MKRLFFTFFILSMFFSVQALAGPCGTATNTASSSGGSSGSTSSGSSSGAIDCSSSSGSAACPSDMWCEDTSQECLPTGPTCDGRCRLDVQNPSGGFMTDTWYQYSPNGGYQYLKCDYTYSSNTGLFTESSDYVIVNELPCDCTGADQLCGCTLTNPPSCESTTFDPSASSSSSSGSGSSTSSSSSSSSGGSGSFECPPDSGVGVPAGSACTPVGSNHCPGVQPHGVCAGCPHPSTVGSDLVTQVNSYAPTTVYDISPAGETCTKFRYARCNILAPSFSWSDVDSPAANPKIGDPLLSGDSAPIQNNSNDDNVNPFNCLCYHDASSPFCN